MTKPLTERLLLMTIRHDTKEEFNVDSEAKCDQLNLAAHVARKKYEKEETKTKQTPVPT